MPEDKKNKKPARRTTVSRKAKPGSLKEQVSNALGKQTQAQKEAESVQRADANRILFASRSAKAGRSGTAAIRNPGLFTPRKPVGTVATPASSGNTGRPASTTTSAPSASPRAIKDVGIDGPLVRTPVTDTRIASLNTDKFVLSDAAKAKIAAGLVKVHRRDTDAKDDDPITLGDFLGAIRRELEVAGAVARTDDPDIPQLEVSSAEVSFSFLIEAVSDDRGVEISTNQEKMDKASASAITRLSVQLKDIGIDGENEDSTELE